MVQDEKATYEAALSEEKDRLSAALHDAAAANARLERAHEDLRHVRGRREVLQLESDDLKARFERLQSESSQYRQVDFGDPTRI